MINKILDKLKKNGLNAVVDLATGNPVSAVATLIGKPDAEEKEVLNQMNRPEVLKILKSHDSRMKELDLEAKKQYLQEEKDKMDFVLKRQELENSDRESARNMYIKTGGKFANKFAVYLVTSCFVFLVLVTTAFVFKSIPDVVLPVITNILGNITGILLSVVAFYYSSSPKDD